MTLKPTRYAGLCHDAEQQQNQRQASVAVVTLAANPRVQSHHSDVQGSLDVIAVPEFTTE